MAGCCRCGKAARPIALDPVTLDTRGVETFGGKLKAFSAHPKVDPATGELFNFGIDYGASTTSRPTASTRAALTRLPSVTLPYPVMNHDFVLTPSYLVFCIGPILVTPLKFLLGFRSFDGALTGTAARPTLILLVPRDGRGKPRFIETDAFFQFHFANGFEEDGALVLDLTRYPDYDTIGEALRDYYKSAWPGHGMAALTRLRIDLATGKVERQHLGHAARPTSSPASTRPGPAGASAMPISPAIPPTARPACSSSSPGSISRPAPWRATISPPTAIPASRSSSPRVPAAQRMMAWW